MWAHLQTRISRVISIAGKTPKTLTCYACRHDRRIWRDLAGGLNACLRILLTAVKRILYPLPTWTFTLPNWAQTSTLPRPIIQKIVQILGWWVGNKIYNVCDVGVGLPGGAPQRVKWLFIHGAIVRAVPRTKAEARTLRHRSSWNTCTTSKAWEGDSPLHSSSSRHRYHPRRG